MSDKKCTIACAQKRSFLEEPPLAVFVLFVVSGVAHAVCRELQPIDIEASEIVFLIWLINRTVAGLTDRKSYKEGECDEDLGRRCRIANLPLYSPGNILMVVVCRGRSRHPLVPIDWTS